MKKILIIGPVFCDLLLDGFQRVPSPGEEEYLNNIGTSIGGVAITAMALNQLGIPTELVTSLGDDLFGRYILEDLRSKEIGTNYITVEKGNRSNLTVIFPFEKDRSFLTQMMDQDCRTRTILEGLHRINLDEFSHIHITFPLLKEKEYKELVSRASDKGLSISADLGFDDAKAWDDSDYMLLKILDYFLPNDKETFLITGEKDVEKAIRILTQWVKTPLVTLGRNGVLLINENDEICRIPAIDIPVINTTGAGDSFTAGFLYGRLNKEPLETSALKGVICGSLTAGAHESVSGQISLKEIREYI